MDKHDLVSRLVRVGLVLLTLLASLWVTTHLVSVTHATPTRPLIHVPLTDYAQPPASWVGKLFITYTKNVNGVLMILEQQCTGTVVGSPNESVVETAAHCFFDNEGQRVPADQMEFCPQYRNGESPLGCWIGQQTFVASHYTWMPLDKQPPTAKVNDYGFLVVSPLGGKLVANVVEGGVTAVNSTLVGTNLVVAYGYPNTAATLNGEELYTCTGTLSAIKVSNGQALQLNGCDLPVGASGGPWFATINGITHLIGNLSTGYGTNSYSPDLATSGWLALFNQATQVRVS